MSTGPEEARAEGRAAVMAARDEYKAAADQWNAALVKGSPDHRHLAMTMHEAELRLDEIKGAHPATWAEIQAEDEAQREREARAASDAEAWGGRGPSASYAEWVAEGREPEAGEADPRTDPMVEALAWREQHEPEAGA